MEEQSPPVLPSTREVPIIDVKVLSDAKEGALAHARAAQAAAAAGLELARGVAAVLAEQDDEARQALGGGVTRALVAAALAARDEMDAVGEMQRRFHRVVASTGVRATDVESIDLDKRVVRLVPKQAPKLELVH